MSDIVCVPLGLSANLSYFCGNTTLKTYIFPMQSRICSLFGIRYPLVQGGMIWNSGWRLASAVSNAGGLGLIGAGSMYPDVLRQHIHKCQEATLKPFGVNIPLLYPEIDALIQLVIDMGVRIVFTSAGSPRKYTARLQAEGIKVVHVVSSSKLAAKCHEAGVDAIVAEGFEAGGHNGREETTTLSLIPAVRQTTDKPLIAAGGIATGQQWLATTALGAEGVQIGSLFAASAESSSHDSFKQAVVAAEEGSTMLSLKQLVPVRLLRNKFWKEIVQMEQTGATTEALAEKLGRGRAKLGMFEGNMDEGELEIGQSASYIRAVRPVAEIVAQLAEEYKQAYARLQTPMF